jgi:flagellar biosynthesis protein FlhA
MTKEELYDTVQLNQIQIQFGYQLVHYFTSEKLSELLERIVTLRIDTAKNTGLMLSPISIQDNLSLGDDNYLIMIRGKVVATGIVNTKKILVLNSSEIKGDKTLDPVFNIPAVWILEEDREDAMQRGLTVLSIETILITHLAEIIKNYSSKLHGRQDTQFLIEKLAISHPKVVEEVTPKYLTVGEITQILKFLLSKGVSILDFLTIMETIGDSVYLTKDINKLTEMVLSELTS